MIERSNGSAIPASVSRPARASSSPTLWPRGRLQTRRPTAHVSPSLTTSPTQQHRRGQGMHGERWSSPGRGIRGPVVSLSWHPHLPGHAQGQGTGRTPSTLEFADMKHLPPRRPRPPVERRRAVRHQQGGCPDDPVGGNTPWPRPRREVVAQIEPRHRHPDAHSCPAAAIRLDGVDPFFREMGIKP